MDASVITALAALTGATVGGFTSVMASWLAQRTQARAQWLAHEIGRLEDLYKEFIEEASTCYVHALQHDEPDIAGLVRLYAKLGQMRILSSPKVLECARRIERTILDTYLAPDKSFLELREMINSGSVDLLAEFSAACRTEFDSLSGGIILKRVLS
jgi:hypothetical protein